MKKVLSIMLSVLLLFSLFALTACGEKTAEESGSTNSTNTSQDSGTTPEPVIDLENSKPNEYVPEKLAAGMEVLIAFCPPELGSTTMVDLEAGFRNGFESAGYTFTTTAFNLDTSQQISAIENFVTMGAAEIITMAFDPSVADVCAMAIESGTYVACWGGAPSFEGFSLATSRDFEAIGGVIADMMIAWADEVYPGQVVKTALLLEIANETHVMQSNAVQAGLEASDNIDIVYTSEVPDPTVDSGFNFAQEALTTNPDTRLFLGFNFGQALGMNNYICAMANVNLDEFGVFSQDMDSSANELLETSANGGGCFRGYASSGMEDMSAYMLELSLQLLNREIEGGTKMEPLWVKTNFSYQYDERV